MSSSHAKGAVAEGLPAYVAFLHGIYVDGEKAVRSEEVKKLFEVRKHKNVRTVTSSGNVLFESARTDIETITGELETALRKKFKRDISVIVRSIEELRGIQNAHPFDRVKMTPETRLYVTFLGEPSRGVKIPKPNPGFEVLQIRYANAYSVVQHIPGTPMIDSVQVLSRIFGPRIAMRNWNTVLNIIQTADAAPAVTTAGPCL